MPNIQSANWSWRAGVAITEPAASDDVCGSKAEIHNGVDAFRCSLLGAGDDLFLSGLAQDALHSKDIFGFVHGDRDNDDDDVWFDAQNDDDEAFYDAVEGPDPCRAAEGRINARGLARYQVQQIGQANNCAVNWIRWGLGGLAGGALNAVTVSATSAARGGRVGYERYGVVGAVSAAISNAVVGWVQGLVDGARTGAEAALDVAQPDEKTITPAELNNLEATEDAIAKLQIQIDKINRGTNATLEAMPGGAPFRLADTERMDLAPAQVGSTWQHSAYGWLGAVADASKTTALASLLPTASNLAAMFLTQVPVIGGVASSGIRVAGSLGGLGVTLATIKNLPSAALVQGAAHAQEADRKKIEPLLIDMGKLEKELEIRNAVKRRLELVLAENKAHKERLNVQLTGLQQVLDSRQQKSNSSFSTGESRRSVLGLAQTAASGFRALFFAVARGVTALAGVVASLPSLPVRVWRQRAECNALRQEDLAFHQKQGTVTRAFRALHGLLSRWCSDETEALLKKAAGWASDDAEKRGGILTGVAKVGNLEFIQVWDLQVRPGVVLAKHLVENRPPYRLGVAVVGDDRVGKWPVNSGLASVRALTWAFESISLSNEARRELDIQAFRTDDGLMIDDPNGWLYDFMMHAPTAYTKAMINTGEGASTATFTLDDYQAGFPRGGKSVSFTREILENGQSRLRLTFSADSGEKIFRPLGNEVAALESLRQVMMRSRNISGEMADEFWSQADEQLNERSAALRSRIQQLDALITVDKQSIANLKYAVLPGSVLTDGLRPESKAIIKA